MNATDMERVIEQKIVLCPKCNGTGILKMTDANGNPVLRMGKPITKSCDLCLQQGRLGYVVKEFYYQLPGSEPQEEEESLLKKIINFGLKGGKS